MSYVVRRFAFSVPDARVTCIGLGASAQVRLEPPRLDVAVVGSCAVQRDASGVWFAFCDEATAASPAGASALAHAIDAAGTGNYRWWGIEYLLPGQRSTTAMNPRESPAQSDKPHVVIEDLPLWDSIRGAARVSEVSSGVEAVSWPLYNGHTPTWLGLRVRRRSALDRALDFLTRQRRRGALCLPSLAVIEEGVPVAIEGANLTVSSLGGECPSLLCIVGARTTIRRMLASLDSTGFVPGACSWQNFHDEYSLGALLSPSASHSPS